MKGRKKNILIADHLFIYLSRQISKSNTFLKKDLKEDKLEAAYKLSSLVVENFHHGKTFQERKQMPRLHAFLSLGNSWAIPVLLLPKVMEQSKASYPHLTPGTQVTSRQGAYSVTSSAQLPSTMIGNQGPLTEQMEQWGKSPTHFSSSEWGANREQLPSRPLHTPTPDLGLRKTWEPFPMATPSGPQEELSQGEVYKCSFSWKKLSWE